MPVSKCLDVGCGTGIASFSLLGLSKHVTGMDPSGSMIDTANSLIKERCDQLNIKDSTCLSFESGSAESLASNENVKNSIDLVTVAEAIHWFTDWPKFFGACYNILKPGGTLAYWIYADPVIADFKGPCISSISKCEIMQKTMAVYDKYTYSDPKYIGPYWNQPGRRILQDMCVLTDEAIPMDLFEDVVKRTFILEPGKAQYGSENHDLVLNRKGILIDEYVDYLTTYSGFYSYKEATGDDKLLRNVFVEEILRETGWDREITRLDLVWNTKYVFMRRK